MHKIHDKEFTLEDFSCENLMDDRNECWNEDIMSGPESCQTPLDILRTIVDTLNVARDLYLKTKDKKYWWQMIQLLPSSYNQTRNVMMNYEVLCNIYKSRKSHPLDEWRELCSWIEDLPYNELICGDEVIDKVADKFCKIGNINPLSKEEIEQAVNLSRIKED